MSRSWLKATLTLTGTIIGAGIFALPQAFAEIGLWKSSFIFWGIALLVCLTHLMLVDIQLASRQKLRLVGAVHRWLGKRVFFFTAISYPCQLIGASLAYILLGASFLQILFAPFAVLSFSAVFWQVLFWGGGALTVMAGLGILAKVESWATWFLIGALLLGSFLVWGSGGALMVSSSWGQAIGLFGLCLFSLGGIAGMGEVVEIAERNRRRAYLATVAGTLTAAFISWIFAVSFAGDGDRSGAVLTWILAFAGLLAVATSFVVIVKDLESTFRLDLDVTPRHSLIYALAIPLTLAFVTTVNVRGVIDAVGTIFGGVNGILVALTASRVYIAHKSQRRSWQEALCILVALAYAIGLGHWVWVRML